MNFITKNRWFATAFIVLILLNIVTLSFFWLTQKDAHPENKMIQGGAFAFLAKELNLDSLQKQQLQVFKEEHRLASQEIRKNNKEAKEVFFGLLGKEGVTEVEINEAAIVAAKHDAELSKITFNHFKKIRSICTTEQQKKFDEIIHEVLRMLVSPQRPPPPLNGMSPQSHPGGAPPHEPPPHEK